jgi:hypothetical protein
MPIHALGDHEPDKHPDAKDLRLVSAGTSSATQGARP